MPRPTKEITLRREKRAWELRQQSWTQQRIADELGVDVSAVCLMLKRVRKRALGELAGDVLTVTAEQHERLDFIANEAMDAWERSKLDAESEEVTEEETEIEGFGGPGAVPATVRKTKRTRKGQTGDPRYLDVAMRAMADQRDIWGIEAPKRTEVETTERKAVTIVEVVKTVVRADAPPALGSRGRPIPVESIEVARTADAHADARERD